VATPLSWAKVPFGKIVSLGKISLFGKDAVLRKIDLHVEVAPCSNIYLLGKVALSVDLLSLVKLPFLGTVALRPPQ
jgi:hypothetical protein